MVNKKELIKMAEGNVGFEVKLVGLASRQSAFEGLFLLSQCLVESFDISPREGQGAVATQQLR